MSHVQVEIFESRDEGCKRYEELLKEVMDDPDTKWKFLSIEMEHFSKIERRANVSTTYSKGWYECIGSYKLIDPAAYSIGIDPMFTKLHGSPSH